MTGDGAFSQEDIHDGAHLPDFTRQLVGNRRYDPFNYGGFSGSREDYYGQDRTAMQHGHFSGLTGNLLQEDMVTQASMGPIVDRTKEHLSSSDVAIIQARRFLLEAIDDMNAGRPVVGTLPGINHSDVLSLDTASRRRTHTSPPCGSELVAALHLGAGQSIHRPTSSPSPAYYE